MNLGGYKHSVQNNAQQTEGFSPPKDTHKRSSSSLIHNCPNLERAPALINREIDKQIVGYPYNGIMGKNRNKSQRQSAE